MRPFLEPIEVETD